MSLVIMRLPKFIRRLKQQRRDAEAITRGRRREAKLGPIRAEIEDAPDWDDGTPADVMEEIRELYGMGRQC
jgi:hypothetical protein